MNMYNFSQILKLDSNSALHFFSRKHLPSNSTSLLCLLLLLSIPFLSVFSGFTFAVDPPKVFVDTETNLRDAVSVATEPTIIVLTDNIQLTLSTLEIPAGSHITLTNDGDVESWQLVGAKGQCTITVNGVLVLDGITVTHTGGNGRGVTVNADGKLVMNSGWIFGNTPPTVDGWGGGVYNLGTFEMLGGVIAGNSAYYGGGGVFNSGIFVVSGANCVIANNTSIQAEANNGGGGVFNSGAFVVSGANCEIIGNVACRGGGVFNNGGNFAVFGANCMIANNTAGALGGGGVCNLGGDFVMSDANCMIVNNTAVASYGGGVYNDYSRTGDFVGSTFTMFGGVIANNTGNSGGGVHNNPLSVFKMYDGVIANNTAYDGGGVCNWGNFTLLNGLILNNTANFENGGGGVYHHTSDNFADTGFFVMSGGVIANNTAVGSYGGGVYFYAGSRAVCGDFTMLGGVIADNSAYYGGGVYNYYGNFTLSGGVIADNSAYYGGGVYSTYGNFTLSGGVIANNTATGSSGANGYGGGVYNYRGNFVMINTGKVVDNTATYGGGGVYTGGTVVYVSSFTMLGGIISNNLGTVCGGGVYNNAGNFVLSADGEIFDNSAEFGGGVFNVGDIAIFTMSGGTVANNTANVDGGGVYIYGGHVEVLAGLIANNTAVESGGGIWVTGDPVDVADLEKLTVSDAAIFSNNFASEAYDRDTIHDTVYDMHIGSNVVWSTPFTQGYNNFDISYVGTSKVAFYYIIYDSNTGTGSMNNMPAFYNKYATLTSNDFSKLGYDFTGWNTFANGQGTSYTNGATFNYTYTDDLILYAQWTLVNSPIVDKEVFMIFYNGNGATAGSVPINNVAYDYGAEVPVATNIGGLARSGYIFLGWAYRNTATTADFVVNDQTVLPSSFEIHTDVVLYAVWQAINYTICYEPGTHGTFNTVTFTGLHYGDSTPTAPQIVGEIGWNFTGWLPNPVPTVNSNATYTAQWTQTTIPTLPTTSPTTTPQPSQPPTTPVTPTTTLPDTTQTPSPTTTPSDNTTDTSKTADSWAITNLLLSIAGIILAAGMGIRVLLLTKKKNTNTVTVVGIKNEQIVPYRIAWLIVTFVLSIASIALCLFTEDMSLTMGIVDKWTFVHVAIFIVEMIACMFIFKRNINKFEQKQTTTISNKKLQ